MCGGSIMWSFMSIFLQVSLQKFSYTLFILCVSTFCTLWPLTSYCVINIIILWTDLIVLSPQIFKCLPSALRGSLRENMFFVDIDTDWPVTALCQRYLAGFTCKKFGSLKPLLTKNSKTKPVAWLWRQEKICQTCVPRVPNMQVCHRSKKTCDLSCMIIGTG